MMSSSWCDDDDDDDDDDDLRSLPERISYGFPMFSWMVSQRDLSRESRK